MKVSTCGILHTSRNVNFYTQGKQKNWATPQQLPNRPVLISGLGFKLLSSSGKTSWWIRPSQPPRQQKHRLLAAHPCDLLSQGSSNNSLAVFRFSGSHCNIDLTKLRNSSLFFPLRFSSAASRLLDGKSGKRSGSFSFGSSHLPLSSNHSADLLPRFTSSSGGGPRTDISSVR